MKKTNFSLFILILGQLSLFIPVRGFAKTDNNITKIVGLSVDTTATETVKNFVKSENINYPIAMANNDILQKFDEIVAVPTSFLIDKNGKVVKKYSGLYMKSTF